MEANQQQTLIKLSIVTVVYNAVKLLPITFDSIRACKNEQIEYIVVDGNSNDGSLDLIAQNYDVIDKKISEKDSGIYDAMNKSFELVTGEFVVFINAGDEIIKAAADAFLKAPSNFDIVYGDAIFVNEKRESLGLRSVFTSRTLPSELNLSSYKMGQRVCHQSFIVRTSIASKYNLQYSISADYDWMLHCIKRSSKNLNLEQPISIFLHGGLSKQQQKKALTQRFWIMTEHFGLLETLWIHFKILLRGIGFIAKNRRLD